MRYRPGWYERATKFLTSLLSSTQIEGTGRVSQQQMSFTFSLLKVNSSDGWYYLKAPPVGCNEVSITSEVAAIFPGSSSLVVATSDGSNSFVSEGFEQVALDTGDFHM